MVNECFFCGKEADSKFTFLLNDNSKVEVNVCDSPRHNFNTPEEIVLFLKLKLGLSNIAKVFYSDKIIPMMEVE